jgi:hypothetical protein
MARTAICWVGSLWLACAAATVAAADELLITAVDSAQASASERPGRGSTMAAVESRFGNPESRQAPVGKPPITRWDYPAFIVYFEFNHVIYAVPRN